MSVADTLVLPEVQASTADRVTRGIAVALAAYFAVVLWPISRDARSTGALIPLATHLAMLAYTLLLVGARGAAWRPALDWLVLTIGPLMYIELRWIIAGTGMPHHDATVVGWERALFPSNPSATLAPHWHLPALSEVLHFAYASYYLIVYLPPIALYVTGKRDAFVKTVLALTIAYGACFIIYALFPVDGPRYLVGPAAAPDGAVRNFVLALLERGSSRGTAFPSSHVAASLVSALCALRYQRRVGLVVAPFVAALVLATVYGGFHYAVDALVGAILGTLAWLTSETLWRAAESRGAHTATAA
ncbi:MAG TPA: phosphatase PAP2 family protein [Gemmatimonadaceae bacterium]